MQRRHFLQTSLVGGISLTSWPKFSRLATAADAGEPPYALRRQTPTRFYDGHRCWSHPRAGIVPIGSDPRRTRVVMTMNSLDVDGSDVFKGVYGLRTDDLGETWTEPAELAALAPRHESINGQERPVAVSDFWPRWHVASGKLLGTGHTVVYTPDWKVTHPRPRHTAYSVYDPQANQWQSWRKLAMPDGDEFHDAGAGCVQRYDEADGTILLPIYFRPPGQNSRVTVARCEFDGDQLRFREHGNVLSVEDKTRGLHEPS
ncbi:MAG: exo-alpha-sialidase, partial [Planctomycetales bacterium]|nr:exo-alpha-sialidase [Planctomycetales bacterium]